MPQLALRVLLLWALSSYVAITCGQTCDHEHYGPPRTVPVPSVLSLADHEPSNAYFGLYLVNPVAPGTAYPHGDLRIHAFTTGSRLHINVQIPGPYHYSATEYEACPSVALMFQVGQNATFWNMGGCPPTEKCDAAACAGHELDVVQFRIGGTIPGRMYRPDDAIAGNITSTNPLRDMHATNAFCIRTDRSAPPASSDWVASWTHSSLPDPFAGFVAADGPFGADGQDGVYTFTLHRALQTEDKTREDVQFQMRHAHLFGVSYWYPADGQPWKPWVHHATCGWLALEFQHQRKPTTPAAPALPRWSMVVTVVLPVLSIVISVAVCLYASSRHSRHGGATDSVDRGQLWPTTAAALQD